MNDRPPSLRLRIFDFDPRLTMRPETAAINEVAVDVPWEDDLKRGPIGAYLEVIRRRPRQRFVLRTVESERPLLAGAGWVAPSESDPQFHQQMMYAVAMTTSVTLGARSDASVLDDGRERLSRVRGLSAKQVLQELRKRP